MRNRKLAVCLMFALLCCDPAYAFTLEEIISKFQRDLSLQIIIDKKVDDSWALVTYDTFTDSTETINYLALLYREYQKYPPGFFDKIRINKIIVCKNLAFDKQFRAAIPDPYNQQLFLALSSTAAYYPTYYLVHVMHHELHHCTEQAIWESMYYQWGKWGKLNNPAFAYKGEGAMAYTEENRSTNWYSMDHPEKGFINLYSTTGQEEDRSELMALLMSDEERLYLSRYYPEDKILRNKLKLLVSRIDKFFTSNDAYWRTHFEQIKRSDKTQK